MKQYLIIILLFLSSIITAQTIITNVVTGIHPETTQGIIIRQDTFYFKSNLIIWNAVEQSTLYHIANYTKLANNVYTIYCSTNNKVIIFIVDFNKGYVILNNDLLFSKTIGL